MTVFVDDVFIPARVGRLNAKWCHLMTDGPPEELHAFAQSIGLQRRWAQHEDRPERLHYDVTESVRTRAVTAGAVEIPWRKIGDLMDAQRTGTKFRYKTTTRVRSLREAGIVLPRQRRG